MNKLQQAILDYYNVRTANAIGLTVEQVRTVNRLEAEHQLATQQDDLFYVEHPEFEVEINDGRVCVGYCDLEFGFWRCQVKPDGKIEYEKF